ncbi:hypothetical protein AVEN_255898-1 [Araneus ventricosus]|uniref:Uncharacterized protein n=1 Tax=Araneus ventricosus TaxID=182803 RepID=A0A4Y2DG68_ARAVE|nr:hypothetical protein AVEN_255898-1 [Araneus ventricosus]
MEGDWIPLKEDSSFEILQLLDDDEIPFEKIRNPKDEIEYFVTEKKDDDNNICKWTNGDTHPIIECNGIAEKEDNDNNICKWTNDYTHPIIECDGIAEKKDDDNNICKWTNDDTHPIIEYNGIASSNFSPLAVKSTIDPVTLYRMDVKEIGNIGCYYPVCSSDHDKVMTSYGFKSSGTNSSIPLNSEAMHKPKEKIETKADRPYEILVISTGEFNCCQVEEQCVPKGFSNHGNNESTKEEYSSWVSRSEQRNEAQSGSIVCEEAAEDNKTRDFLTR